MGTPSPTPIPPNPENVTSLDAIIFFVIISHHYFTCTRVVWKVSDLNMKMAALVNEG